MPRNKKKKDKIIPNIPGPSTNNVAKVKQDSDFNLEKYGLDIMQSFMKSDEEILAICYRVNTGNVGKEDIVNKYKNTMITALQRKAREKGYMVSVEKIIFNCLPLGEDSLIKAYAPLKNVQKARSGEPVIEKTVNDPFSWNVKG